jgi:SWI/SNF-related matrix-associated actin-dependent regulator of chromatin subfamily A3
LYSFAEDQAIDRVHRLGQKRHVEVVRFVIKGSVEEKILKMQTDKRCMAMQALTRNTRGRETQQAARLEDLVHLFE